MPKSGYDFSRTVTTTRAVLVTADQARTSLLISSPVTNLVRLSINPAAGTGGFVLIPGASPIKLTLD